MDRYNEYSLDALEVSCDQGKRIIKLELENQNVYKQMLKLERKEKSSYLFRFLNDIFSTIIFFYTLENDEDWLDLLKKLNQEKRSVYKRLFSDFKTNNFFDSKFQKELIKQENHENLFHFYFKSLGFTAQEFLKLIDFMDIKSSTPVFHYTDDDLVVQLNYLVELKNSEETNKIPFEHHEIENLFKIYKYFI